jgi:plasmid stability protein
MAQLTVRHLEATVMARLKLRAVSHGWSFEEEVRQLLRAAVSEDRVSPPRLGSRIATRFTAVGLGAELTEFHGRATWPLDDLE